MRLRQLTLTRYGHFNAASLDFGPARDCDVTVVYGDNEAGKSTAFAAWLDLLFGFPKTSPYAFRYPLAQLEVGASFNDADGAFAIRRTPKALLDAEGHPLEELRLNSVRGGLDRDTFATRFSLDDATMRAGGRAIASGRGDLGEALHVGASGRVGFGAGMAELGARLSGFHVKGGRKTVAAVAKRDLAALKAQIADAELAPSGWDKLQAGVETAEADVASAQAQLSGARRARALHARAAKLREVLSALARVEASLHDAPKGPALPTDAATRHAELTARRDASERAGAKHALRIAEQGAALGKLGFETLPDPIPAASLGRAVALLPDVMETVQALASRQAQAKDLADALPEAEDGANDLGPLEVALAALPDAERLHEATERLQLASHTVQEAAIGLGPNWETPVASGLPEREEIASIVSLHQKALDTKDHLAEAHRDNLDRLESSRQAVVATESLPSLVSQEARDAARLARDAAWDAHRAALDPDSADSFAAAMRRDDLLQTRFADGETARLRLAQARETLVEAEAVAQQSGARLAEAQTQARVTEQNVQALAERLGAPPSTPASALSSWAERLREAMRAKLAQDRASDSLRALEARDAEARAALALLVGDCETDLRQRAEERLREMVLVQNRIDARAKAQARLAALGDQIVELQDQAETQEARLRTALAGTDLAGWSLSQLHQSLHGLHLLAQAQEAKAEADHDLRQANKALDDLLTGQGSREISALLARDKARAEKEDMQLQIADLRTTDTAAIDAELDQGDPDRAAKLATQEAEAESRLAHAQAQLGAARQARDSVWTGEGADRLRRDRAALLAGLERHARNAAAAMIGQAIGQRALAIYEAENRGALLAATQTAFARLTGGAWPGLATDSDGKGGQALFAVNAQGRTRVDQLSTGTQGQIYLALRLAGYALYAQTDGARPFVLDDIAETFDDTRAREAMVMLGELGRHGQAIFFTHHRHLVDMAQDALPDVRVIEMPPRAVTAANGA